jgi:uncharacterized protein
MAENPPAKRPAAPPRPCPVCGKPRAEKYRPFCSRRCADVDLAHWLGGRYAIPGADTDEDGPVEPPTREK